MGSQGADRPGVVSRRSTLTTRDSHRQKSISPNVYADARTTWLAAREKAALDGYTLPLDHPSPGCRVAIPGFGKGPRNRSARAWLSPDCEVVVVKDWSAEHDRPLVYRPQRWDMPLPADCRRNRKRALKQMALRRIEQAEKHRQGTLSARVAWEAARPCIDHPYMRKKGEWLPGCRVDDFGSLLVPRIDVAGNLVGLQRIQACGRKLYWPGAPTAGTFYLLGEIEPSGILLVCEGVATGATLWSDTAHPVVCAMDAGNLLAVCEALRARYPHADIVVAGDDDRSASVNIGRSKAAAAARAIGARQIFPTFCDQCDCGGTDFNDAAICFAEAVSI